MIRALSSEEWEALTTESGDWMVVDISSYPTPRAQEDSRTSAAVSASRTSADVEPVDD